MFQNDDLLNHLQTSSSIKAQALVVAEWNLNIADNIFKVGNYRYRPTGTDQYKTLANSFDEYDQETFTQEPLMQVPLLMLEQLMTI